MTDRALVNAKQRRDEIAAKINQLNQELEEKRKELAAADRFIADWHAYADLNAGAASHTDAAVNNTQNSQGSDTAAKLRAPKNPDRTVVGRHAWEIISQEGRPVPRQDLFSALAKRGVHIHGKDPEMVLSTMMWRMQEHFVRIPKWGYWKRNQAFPQAGYAPGVAVEPDGEDAAVIQNSILDPASVADA